MDAMSEFIVIKLQCSLYFINILTTIRLELELKSNIISLD